MMKQLLNTAITAALEAGKAILEIYHSGEFDVEIKGDNSPLTIADTASHNVIVSYLEKTEIAIVFENIQLCESAPRAFDRVGFFIGRFT